MSRLVQQQAPALNSWDDDPGGVRAGPLRDSEPRAVTRIGAAENLGRFNDNRARVLALHTRSEILPSETAKSLGVLMRRTDPPRGA